MFEVSPGESLKTCNSVRRRGVRSAVRIATTTCYNLLAKRHQLLLDRRFC